MNNLISDLRSAAGFGFLLLLPLMAVEVINGSASRYGFPFVLFVLLWLLSLACIFVMMPLIRDARNGKSILATPTSFLLRTASALLIAVVWASIVKDQAPCFLGIPNCD